MSVAAQRAAALRLAMSKRKPTDNFPSPSTKRTRPTPVEPPVVVTTIVPQHTTTSEPTSPSARSHVPDFQTTLPEENVENTTLRDMEVDSIGSDGDWQFTNTEQDTRLAFIDATLLYPPASPIRSSASATHIQDSSDEEEEEEEEKEEEKKPSIQPMVEVEDGSLSEDSHEDVVFIPRRLTEAPFSPQASGPQNTLIQPNPVASMHLTPSSHSLLQPPSCVIFHSSSHTLSELPQKPTRPMVLPWESSTTDITPIQMHLVDWPTVAYVVGIACAFFMILYA
jgi:hypothetical protein